VGIAGDRSQSGPGFRAAQAAVTAVADKDGFQTGGYDPWH